MDQPVATIPPQEMLKPIGVFKLQPEHGVQFYQVVGQNSFGVNCILTFGCMMCYTDAMDKAFHRLQPVNMEVTEEVKPTEEKGDQPDGTVQPSTN